MSQMSKLILRLLAAESDASFSMAELARILRYLGFEERQVGSHHVYSLDQLARPLVLQSRQGRAKPYQVRQVRDTIVSNELWRDDDAEV